MGKNKTQNLLAALLAAIVSNVLLYILRLVLRIPVANMFMAILINTIEGTVILGAATAIFCVALAKKNPNVGALIGLSIAGGLVSTIIAQISLLVILPRGGLDMLGIWSILSIVVRFLIFFGAAFLILNLSKEKNANPYAMYGNPYYTPNSQAQNPYNNYNSSNTPGVSSTDASAASADKATEKNGEEENA